VLLVDTGIFVSAADQDEPRHSECADLLRAHQDLAVTASVIPEAAWMIERRLGPSAEIRFLTLVTSTRFDIVDLTPEDHRRVIELIGRYADLGLGYVDASIVAVAERLAVTTIATLNRRDFAVVRPTHCDALDLIP
jgi:predicted nucleic acid-binding protein